MKANISHIGKTLYPKDNSFGIFINTNERAAPANNRGVTPSPVKILSVPFIDTITNVFIDSKDFEFVLVEYGGKPVRILNNFFTDLETAEKETHYSYKYLYE